MGINTPKNNFFLLSVQNNLSHRQGAMKKTLHLLFFCVLIGKEVIIVKTYKGELYMFIYAFFWFNPRSFICALTKLAGDSSSNCCVGGAILGCRLGYSRLPRPWVEGLRNRQLTWLNTKINHLLDIVGLP